MTSALRPLTGRARTPAASRETAPQYSNQDGVVPALLPDLSQTMARCESGVATWSEPPAGSAEGGWGFLQRHERSRHVSSRGPALNRARPYAIVRPQKTLGTPTMPRSERPSKR